MVGPLPAHSQVFTLGPEVLRGLCLVGAAPPLDVPAAWPGRQVALLDGHGHGTMVAGVIARVAPKVVVPHHYYIWNVVQRQSTLLPAEKWLASQDGIVRLDGAEMSYSPDTLPAETEVHSFGDHVAFDVDAWHRENGLVTG